MLDARVFEDVQGQRRQLLFVQQTDLSHTERRVSEIESLKILEQDSYAQETKKIVLNASMSAFRFYQKTQYVCTGSFW